jgi:hypothetical protein
VLHSSIFLKTLVELHIGQSPSCLASTTQALCKLHANLLTLQVARKIC